MLRDRLRQYRVILASGSPRRQEYLEQLGIDFEIHLKEIEEAYPSGLKRAEITEFLSKVKANAFLKEMRSDEILITSDTIVWYQEEALGKPADRKEAMAMLRSLSGQWHEVITSVCFTTLNCQRIASNCTSVKFKELTAGEIDYYITTFDPLDKAGAYGIQEWIGLIAIEEIQGSYANVVGLPTHLVYKMLTDISS